MKKFIAAITLSLVSFSSFAVDYTINPRISCHSDAALARFIENQGMYLVFSGDALDWDSGNGRVFVFQNSNRFLVLVGDKASSESCILAQGVIDEI